MVDILKERNNSPLASNPRMYLNILYPRYNENISDRQRKHVQSQVCSFQINFLIIYFVPNKKRPEIHHCNGFCLNFINILIREFTFEPQSPTTLAERSAWYLENEMTVCIPWKGSAFLRKWIAYYILYIKWRSNSLKLNQIMNQLMRTEK